MAPKNPLLPAAAAGLAAGTAIFAGLYWSLTRGAQPPGFAAVTLCAALAAAVAAAVPLAAARKALAARAAAHAFDAERLAAANDAAGRADAALAHDRRWLEAILHDLGEAVVVASPDDRLLLFNARARTLLEPCGPVGLRRELGLLADTGAIRAALDAAGPDGHALAQVRLRDGRGPFAARVAWVRDASGGAEAYVATFAAPEAAPAARPPARPEFYDFDLARLKPASGAAGERPLSALAYVVFDLETTGLDTARDDIVSIGAVRALGTRVLASETFATLVDPRRPIPPASTEFHGIDDAAVRGAPDAAAAAAAFLAFAHGAILVAHNAAFDLAFLRRAAAVAGITFDNPPFDTLLIARWLFPDLADHSLDGLAALLGVETGRRHAALDDARATAEIFARLLELCERRGVASYAQLAAASNLALEMAAAARRLNPAAGP